MSAARPSSLPPLEDRFSVIFSRLDRIENSLKCLEDIKKVLVEIEGNTHPDSDGILRASLCKILISSFAHKIDFAHNFSVDFFK